MKTITYPLTINEELWKRYKATVSRTTSLNNSLVELIKKKVLKEEA